MRNRMTSVCDQLIDFLTGIVNWLWDTLELITDIILEFLIRGIELVIAILHLVFQVICFLRDLCIEAMQTFVSVFRGFVNIVSSFNCEDVEEFATACIVVLLWFGAIKIAVGFLDKRKAQPFSNALSLLPSSGNKCSPSGGKFPAFRTTTKKRGKETQRNCKRAISLSSSSSSME